jgi:hypothetical protein
MNTLALRSRIDRLGEKGLVQPLLVLCVQGWIIGMDCQTKYFGGTVLCIVLFFIPHAENSSVPLKTFFPSLSEIHAL